jgi:hypothetical protein
MAGDWADDIRRLLEAPSPAVPFRGIEVRGG